MFTLVHQYKYTLTELENMIPWERETDKANQDLRQMLKPKSK